MASAAGGWLRSNPAGISIMQTNESGVILPQGPTPRSRRTRLCHGDVRKVWGERSLRAFLEMVVNYFSS